MDYFDIITTVEKNFELFFQYMVPKVVLVDKKRQSHETSVYFIAAPSIMIFFLPFTNSLTRGYK